MFGIRLIRSRNLPERVPRVATTIEKRIHTMRGHRVMLSPDLARRYGVEPRALVQAVVRNRQRFPSDFMFQLTARDLAKLKSQTVISTCGMPRRPLAN
jgi:hypothetical protein